MPAEAEGIAHGHLYSHLPGIVGDEVQIAALRVRVLIINSRRHYAPLYGQGTDNQLHRAGSAQQVAHHALGGTDRYAGGRVIKDPVDSPGLYLVPQGGRSGMGINIINGLGATPGIGQGNVHGISGTSTTRLRGSHVASICTESVAQ